MANSAMPAIKCVCNPPPNTAGSRSGLSGNVQPIDPADSPDGGCGPGVCGGGTGGGGGGGGGGTGPTGPTGPGTGPPNNGGGNCTPPPPTSCPTAPSGPSFNNLPPIPGYPPSGGLPVLNGPPISAFAAGGGGNCRGPACLSEPAQSVFPGQGTVGRGGRGIGGWPGGGGGTGTTAGGGTAAGGTCTPSGATSSGGLPSGGSSGSGSSSGATGGSGPGASGPWLSASGAVRGMLVPGGNVTIAQSFPPPILTNRFGAGDLIFDRAAQAAGAGADKAFPTLTLPTSVCRSLGGTCQINPANGNLLLQFSTPASDVLTLSPVFSYCSTNATNTSEQGNGWSHTFKRNVVMLGPHGSFSPRIPVEPTVTTGVGQEFAYTKNSSGGYQPPASPAINSLQAPVGFATFTETQPNGTFFQYIQAGAFNLHQHLRPE